MWRYLHPRSTTSSTTPIRTVAAAASVSVVGGIATRRFSSHLFNRTSLTTSTILSSSSSPSSHPSHRLFLYLNSSSSPSLLRHVSHGRRSTPSTTPHSSSDLPPPSHLHGHHGRILRSPLTGRPYDNKNLLPGGNSPTNCILPFPTYASSSDITLSQRLRWFGLELLHFTLAVGISQLSILIFTSGPSYFEDPLEGVLKGSIFSTPLLGLTYVGLIQLTRKRFRILGMEKYILVKGPPGLTRSKRFKRIGLILGCIFVAMFIHVVLNIFTDTHERNLSIENQFLVEVMADVGNSHFGWTGWSIGLTGPIFEEIIFRGLIFARCYRMLGPFAAFLISSLAFGLAHAPDPKKVPHVTFMGLLYAKVFEVTHSVLPSSCFHVVNNVGNILSRWNLNPMVPVSTQLSLHSLHLSLLTLLDGEELFLKLCKKVFVPYLPSFYGHKMLKELLEDDLTELKPDIRLKVHELFHQLDHDRKGYLNLEEWCWLSTLMIQSFRDVRTSCNIVGRRGSPVVLSQLSDETRRSILKGMEQSSPFPIIRLPHECTLGRQVHYVTQSNEMVQSSSSSSSSVNTVIDRSSSPSASPSSSSPGSTYLFSNPHVTLRPLGPLVGYEETRPRHAFLLTTSQQQYVLRRWLTVEKTMEYVRLFHRHDVKKAASQVVASEMLVSSPSASLPSPSSSAASSLTTPPPLVSFPCNGCTLPAFEAYVARRILLNPDLASEWLTRTSIVLSGQQPHPIEAVWKIRTPKNKMVHIQ